MKTLALLVWTLLTLGFLITANSARADTGNVAFTFIGWISPLKVGNDEVEGTLTVTADDYRDVDVAQLQIEVISFEALDGTIYDVGGDGSIDQSVYFLSYVTNPKRMSIPAGGGTISGTWQVIFDAQDCITAIVILPPFVKTFFRTV